MNLVRYDELLQGHHDNQVMHLISWCWRNNWKANKSVAKCFLFFTVSWFSRAGTRVTVLDNPPTLGHKGQNRSLSQGCGGGCLGPAYGAWAPSRSPQDTSAAARPCSRLGNGAAACTRGSWCGCQETREKVWDAADRPSTHKINTVTLNLDVLVQILRYLLSFQA